MQKPGVCPADGGRRSGARVDAVGRLDANEMLMRTIAGLRRFYPYFDINSGKPANTWIDTMHAARISGGDVSNIISGRAEALLDIRLTETSAVEDLAKNLREACAPGVSYEIVSASTPVVMVRIIRKFWLIKAGRTGNRAENRFRADWRGNRCAAFCGKRGDGDNAFRYGRGHACRRRICGLAVGRRAGTDSD